MLDPSLMISTVILEMHAATPRLYFHPRVAINSTFKIFFNKRQKYIVQKLVHLTIQQLGHLLRPDIVHFHFTHFGTEIFLRELTLSKFEHAEFKSEKFLLRRHAVFSQTAILSSLISRQIIFSAQRHSPKTSL